MPTVPSTASASSTTASRVPSRRSTTVRSSAVDVGLADGVGQVGVEPDPIGVGGREVVDLLAVAVVRRQVELVPRPCRRAPLAGRRRLGRHRPGRLRRVADDGPGRGAATAADHPPLHRGEVLGLVDEHVGVAVVLDPHRRARVLPGLVAVDEGGQLGHLVVEQVRERVVVVVPVPRGLLGHVTELVAELVEQRDVLDRPVVGGDAVLPRLADLSPRAGQQRLVLTAEHALGDPRAARPGRAASPSTSVASSGGHQASTKSTKAGGAEQHVVELVAAAVTARGRRAPGATSRRAGRRRPAAPDGCACPGRAAGGGSSASSRGPSTRLSSR